MESKTIGEIVEKFPLSKVYSRFLCGSSALRNARKISRMQLYLAMLDLDNSDIHARILVADIRRYESGNAFLRSKKKLTIKDILKVHRKVLPEAKHSGKLRKNEGWIGKSRQQATYIAPPAERVEPLLNDFINTLNQQTNYSSETIIRLYSQFLTIHPFRDGNGRISRLLVEYLLNKAGMSTHFSLFRLGMSISKYQDAVLSFGIKSNLGMESPYWVEMKNWITDYEVKVQILLQQLRTKLEARLALYPLSELDLTIIELLMKQPIITLQKLKDEGVEDLESNQLSISKLIAANVLKPYKIKGVVSNEVFVCRDVCEFTMKIDELLFSGKQS